MIKLFLKSNQEEAYRSVRVVQGQTVTFGSSPMADFYLASDALDEIHCRLAIQRAGCFLECISNHSFFFRNGKKLDRCRLKDGDVLGLAEFDFQVEIESKVTLTATQSSPKDFSEENPSVNSEQSDQGVEEIADNGHAETSNVQTSEEKQINEFVVDASDTETAEVDSMDFTDLFEHDLQYSELGDVRRAKGLTENESSPETDGSATIESDSSPSLTSSEEGNTAYEKEEDPEDDGEESAGDPGTVEPELFDYDGHDSSFDVDSYSGELLYDASTDYEPPQNDIEQIDFENNTEPSNLDSSSPGSSDDVEPCYSDSQNNDLDDSDSDDSDSDRSELNQDVQSDSVETKDSVDDSNEQENVSTENESAIEDKEKIGEAEQKHNSAEQAAAGKPVFSARLSNNGSVWRYSINSKSLFEAMETSTNLYQIKAGRGAGEILEFDFETQNSDDLMTPAIFAIDPTNSEDLSVFAMQYRTRIQHPRALSTFLSFAPKVACEKFFSSIGGVLLTDQFEDPEILTLQPPNEFGPAMGGIIEFE